MNFALELKNMPFAKFTPAPKSMLITLSGTVVISCLANMIVQGGGGVFTWDWDIQKFPKCLNSFCNRLWVLIATAKAFGIVWRDVHDHDAVRLGECGISCLYACGAGEDWPVGMLSFDIFMLMLMLPVKTSLLFILKD